MSRDRTADLRGPTSNNGGGRYQQGPPQRNNSGGNGGYYNDDVEMSRYPPAQGGYSQRDNYDSNNNSSRYQQRPQHDEYYQSQPQGGRYPPANNNNNSYSRSNSDSTLPGGRGGNVARVGGGGSTIDSFFEDVESVKSGIEQVKQNVRSIDQLHQRALLGTSPDEQARYTRQVDDLQAQTSDLINDLRTHVKQLAAATKTASAADRPVRDQQQKALASKLMDVAQQYQEVQLRSKQKYRQRMEREIRIARPDATPSEVERALDSNNGQVFSQQLLSSRVGAQRTALQEVQNRHEEIHKIEQSVTELFTLFQEMQALLEQQQETIDVIETQVDDTHVNIEDGNKEMTQAIVHRKASRKKAWWICICVLILIVILVIVLYIYVIKPAIDTANAAKQAGAK
ncbi:t-SNARE [Fimicolochytrium jonesii]|uniref:t-SNARE n=1 Tax=Fimicolochytrium jonesii TaxID=1396493 RepID=UPI0022FEF8EB|nr:t-SNARE [Fimicolochytrium jonesii]KAI8817545.1 t-SNARE [Fimicolochytrium jonesii]